MDIFQLSTTPANEDSITHNYASLNRHPIYTSLIHWVHMTHAATTCNHMCTHRIIEHAKNPWVIPKLKNQYYWLHMWLAIWVTRQQKEHGMVPLKCNVAVTLQWLACDSNSWCSTLTTRYKLTFECRGVNHSYIALELS